MKAAAFLDRDGTIIEERHYIADPVDVVLIPGAAEALRALAGAGFLLVIVTNQSGIARGLYGAPEFEAVQQRLLDLLREQEVRIDAVFHCPQHPDFTGRCECRKPGLGMYLEAAARLDIDLRRSVFIGDRTSDVLPAVRTGGRGFLVRTGYGSNETGPLPDGVEAAADLAEAVRRLLTAVA
jgi:D-glycero-D-manno-heptose 1,7-bisphosphate phosphatase